MTCWHMIWTATSTEMKKCESDEEGSCPICRSQELALKEKEVADSRTEKEKREKHYEFLYQWGGRGGGLVLYTAEDRAEYRRAWNFYYNRRPEVKAGKKAYMAAWRQIPEVKVYEKAYRDAYRALPGVRERDNALRKLRHARAKERAIIAKEHGG